MNVNNKIILNSYKENPWVCIWQIRLTELFLSETRDAETSRRCVMEMQVINTHGNLGGVEVLCVIVHGSVLYSFGLSAIRAEPSRNSAFHKRKGKKRRGFWSVIRRRFAELNSGKESPLLILTTVFSQVASTLGKKCIITENFRSIVKKMPFREG